MTNHQSKHDPKTTGVTVMMKPEGIAEYPRATGFKIMSKGELAIMEEEVAVAIVNTGDWKRVSRTASQKKWGQQYPPTPGGEGLLSETRRGPIL